MPALHKDLLEKDILGPDTIETIVRAEQCPSLRRRYISHVGIADAAAPLFIVRTRLSGTYLHGTIGGEGRMLIDGHWRTHRTGKTSLAPPHVMHAFRAIPSKRWQYCWVRYMPESPRSVGTQMDPVMANVDARPLAHAILGLYFEVASGGDNGSCGLWVDVIERYVDRFVIPWRKEERLVKPWAAVQLDLARDWRLKEMAELAKLSREHFRRLCQRNLGRSPMQQLAYLRVQHAAHLLATTSGKVEAVAQQVGYQNPFAFSNTFKRMTGFRPSIYRVRSSIRMLGSPT